MSLSNQLKHDQMDLPDLVIFYNRWRNVAVPEVHDCFEIIPETTLKAIKRGNTYWIRSEPYAYAAGKVYGYERIKIVGTHTTVHVEERGKESETLRYIDFNGALCSGSLLVESNILSLYRLTDQAKLEELVRKYGDQITHVHDAEHHRHLVDLRRAFEAEWDHRGFPR